jgi:hypothetical protein
MVLDSAREELCEFRSSFSMAVKPSSIIKSAPPGPCSHCHRRKRRHHTSYSGTGDAAPVRDYEKMGTNKISIGNYDYRIDLTDDI